MSFVKGFTTTLGVVSAIVAVLVPVAVTGVLVEDSVSRKRIRRRKAERMYEEERT